MNLTVRDFLDVVDVKVTTLRNNMRQYMDVSMEQGVIINDNILLVNIDLIDRAYMLKEQMPYIASSLLLVSENLMSKYKDDPLTVESYLSACCLNELSLVWVNVLHNSDDVDSFKVAVTDYCIYKKKQLPDATNNKIVTTLCVLLDALNSDDLDESGRMINLFSDLLLLKAGCSDVLVKLQELKIEINNVLIY